jgi:hypothetical protein
MLAGPWSAAAAPAHFALASVLFFKRDLPAFRRAAERAIDLNPMDANSVAGLAA